MINADEGAATAARSPRDTVKTPWRRRWPGRDCAKLWLRYANKDEVSVELPLNEGQRKRVERLVATLIAEAAHGK